MSGRSLYLPNLQHPITMCVIYNQFPKQEEPSSCATAMLGDSMGRPTGLGLLWAASRGSKSCPAEASLNHSFEGHSCSIDLFKLSQDGIAPIKAFETGLTWVVTSLIPIIHIHVWCLWYFLAMEKDWLLIWSGGEQGLITMIYWIHCVFTSFQIVVLLVRLFGMMICVIVLIRTKNHQEKLFNVQEISSTEHQMVNLILKMTCYRLAPPILYDSRTVGMPAGWVCPFLISIEDSYKVIDLGSVTRALAALNVDM